MPEAKHVSNTWLMLAVGLGLMLGACTPSGEPGTGPAHPSREDAMETRSQIEFQPAAIPPIDAAAPREVATATFGLG